MPATRIKALCVALGLAMSWQAPAQVPVPPLGARVTDQTATLTPDQVQTLEQTLREFEARKGSQLAVLIVPSTAPETIEQFGIRVAERWKLGRTRVDDGAILIVARNDRTVRIEVGYGLEGALTDATSKRIISEIIVPRFAQGDFYGGITEGVNGMIRVVDAEPLPQPKPMPETRGPTLQQYAPVLLILAFVIGGFLRSMLGKFPGALVTGGVLGLIVWLFAGALVAAIIAGVIGFLFTLLGGGMPGGLMGSGGFGGGGFGGGGFGGGGFGGGGGFSGGGGGFGGGGASGRW
ncbi:MAG TPA: YgcG family protein [Steroidobacteraceae bacterium]|nr:YgcG family protein [Steroidobacteraceae bacterium]